MPQHDLADLNHIDIPYGKLTLYVPSAIIHNVLKTVETFVKAETEAGLDKAYPVFSVLQEEI